MDDETYQKIKGCWILNGTPERKESLPYFDYGSNEITIEQKKEYPVGKLKGSAYVPEEDDIPKDPVYYKVEKNVPVICAPGRPCILYQNKTNDIYYKTSWRGVLKKLVFTDSGIYLYHLKYNQWELDTLSKNGKYWYIEK
ncbi:MAG: hypothetical protein WCR31_11570 [Treponema sp.]